MTGTMAYFRTFQLKPIHSKILHNAVGTVSFVMGTITFLLGTLLYIRTDVRYSLMSLAVITSTLVLIGPFKDFVNLIKTVLC